nr:hypothetical protein [Tanacetum cinerariifolium]
MSLKARSSHVATFVSTHLNLAARFKVEDSSAVSAARKLVLDVANVDATPGRLVSKESEARCTQQAWPQAMDCNRAVHAELQAYRSQKMPPKRTATTATTTTPMTDTQLKALIAQGVADALVEINANRTSRNGDDSYDLGTSSIRTERAAHKSTYSDFLKCQPLNFNGTEGVVGLAHWTVTHKVAYGMTWKALKDDDQ